MMSIEQELWGKADIKDHVSTATSETADASPVHFNHVQFPFSNPDITGHIKSACLEVIGYWKSYISNRLETTMKW